LATAQKEESVQELEDRVSRCTISIGTHYSGLSVAEMTVLRRRMRESGVEVRVVKNTLLRRAATAAGRATVADVAEGPTAVLFGFGDVAQAAKSVQEYLRTARNSLTVHAAWVDGELMPATALADLASLPSREQLLVNFLGGLRSPIQTFAGLIAGTLQTFAGLIDARANQLEGDGAAA
jgi:large subunit ribosomal protein L10